MSEKIGEFYYEIKADGKAAINEIGAFGKTAGGTLGDLSGMLGGLKLGFVALAAAIAAGAKFVGEALKSAMENARAFAVLENSLNKVGLTVADVEGKIKEMSRTSAVDDEQIAQIINYAAAYNVPKEKLMEFTQATLDYAAQTGKEIPLAMRTMKSEIEKGGTAFDNMARSVSGSAQKLADADGGYKRLGVTAQELKESFGTLIFDAFKPAIQFMQSIVDWAQQIIDKLTEMKRLNQIQNAPETIKNYETSISLMKKQNSEIDERLKKGQKVGAYEKEMYDDNIKEIKREQGEIKKLQDMVHAPIKGQGVAGITEEALKKLTEEAQKLGEQISSKLLSLADQIYAKDPFSKMLIDVIDINDQFNKMNADLIAAGKSAKTFGDFISEMSTGNKLSLIISAFKGIASAVNGIAEAGNDWLYSMSDAAKQAQSLAELNRLLDRYKNNLDAINLKVDQFRKGVTDTDITASDTEEGINEKIAARRALINGNTEAMKANQKIVNEVEARYKTNDLGTLRKNLKDAYSYQVDAMQAYIDSMPDKILGIFDNQNKKDAQKRLDRIKKELEAQIAAVEAAITAKKAIGDLDTGNKQINKEIMDLEKQKLDIINAQLEAQKKITEELQSQTVEEIRNLIATGQIDVQNLGSISNIGKKLNSVGISGMSQLVTMKGFGISNADTRRVIIGNVQMPVYNGNNNNIGASAFAAAQFGGN